MADGTGVSSQLKEQAMNEAKELELVELGEAKEVTKGSDGPKTESANPPLRP